MPTKSLARSIIDFIAELVPKTAIPIVSSLPTLIAKPTKSIEAVVSMRQTNPKALAHDEAINRINFHFRTMKNVIVSSLIDFGDDIIDRAVEKAMAEIEEIKKKLP